MKDKIFISHSSAWKESVVKPLVELLGRDMAVVDLYNFESGEEIWAEIRKAITDCRYFLFLISKEALREGGWVEREINFVRDLVDEGKVLFWPVIIDNEVEWSDYRIKPWIQKEYITDHYATIPLLAHLVQNKVRKDLYARDEKLKARRTLFMGHDADLSALKGMLSDRRTDSDIPNPNTLIISGLRHLGRKRFLKEFLSREVKTNTTPEDFFTISLDASDDEWAFLQKLNNIVSKYQPWEITDIYNHREKVLPLIKDLYKVLRDNKSTVVILDDGAIVKRNGHLANWVVGLIRIPEFNGDLMFNIVSRFRPAYNITTNFPTVITMSIREIEKAWLIRLFKEYALICNIPVSETLAEECVKESNGYPLPVYKAVEALTTGGQQKGKIRTALNTAKAVIESDFRIILEELQNECPRAVDVLTVLSRVPLMSDHDLATVIGSGLYDYLDVLDNYSVLLFSGIDNSLISANPGIANYIRRRPTKLPDEMEQRYNELVFENIKNFRMEGMDIAGYMLAARESIKNNPSAIPDDLCIPSLVLRLMMEYYYQGNNDLVISMADQVLKGYSRLTKEMERSIRYWLCSALCRKGDTRAPKEIKFFDTNSYSHNFLMGFYYRHKIGDHERSYCIARDYYMSAYELTFANNDSEFDDAKLLHELWIVKFSLRESDALDFAKKCYERRPTNFYHVEAYFRSLVRSKSADTKDLNNLVKAMRSSDDSHKLIIANTMEAEIKYFKGNNIAEFVKSIENIISNNIESDYIKYPFRVLREICELNDSLQIYNGIKKKYSDFAEDFDYPHIPD